MVTSQMLVKTVLLTALEEWSLTTATACVQDDYTGQSISVWRQISRTTMYIILCIQEKGNLQILMFKG